MYIVEFESFAGKFTRKLKATSEQHAFMIARSMAKQHKWKLITTQFKRSA